MSCACVYLFAALGRTSNFKLNDIQNIRQKKVAIIANGSCTVVLNALQPYDTLHTAAVALVMMSTIIHSCC